MRPRECVALPGRAQAHVGKVPREGAGLNGTAADPRLVVHTRRAHGDRAGANVTLLLRPLPLRTTRAWPSSSRYVPRYAATSVSGAATSIRRAPSRARGAWVTTRRAMPSGRRSASARAAGVRDGLRAGADDEDGRDGLPRRSVYAHDDQSRRGGEPMGDADSGEEGAASGSGGRGVARGSDGGVSCEASGTSAM